MTQAAEQIDTRQRTLLLADLSAIFWRNWHATANEDLSEAQRRTVDKIRVLADGFDHVAICCDAPPYKRTEIRGDYKANRDKKDATSVEQLRRTAQRLKADGFLLWGAKGYEADDVIATACRYAQQDGIAVTIASADKDLLQLVGPSVEMLSTATGDRLNSDAVVEKFGVDPAHLGDLLALMGDASDNVRGVDGIGIKSAAALIREFGTLASILMGAADEDDTRIKPAQRKALNAAGKEVLVSRQLVQLYTDVPIDWAQLYEDRAPQTAAADTWEEPDDMGNEDDMGQIDQNEAPPEISGQMVDAAFAKKSQPEAPPPQCVDEPPPTPPSSPTGSAAMVLTEPMTFERRLEPNDPGTAWKLAKVLHDSRMWPAFGSPSAVMAALLTGRGIGLNATQSLQGIDVIKGKPALKTVTLIGLIKTSDKCKFWRMVSSTPERAVFETQRVGDPEPTRYEMTIEEARQAGWASADQWKKQPATMLRWRCQSTLARIVYPDICAGLYTPEELEDAA